MANTKWDYGVFWKEAIQQIRSEISDQEYLMWFSNLAYEGSQEGEIILSVPSSFYKDQVRQRYQSLLEEKLFDLSGFKIAVTLTVKKKQPSQGKEPISPSSPVTTQEEQARTKSPTPASKGSAVASGTSVSTGSIPAAATYTPIPPTGAPQKKSRGLHPQLRKEYTFENFVIGVNNSFAANAALAIAKNPGTAYNPCLIYGGVGLGKTHLIQSIGHSVYSDFPDFKVVYVTAENFTNEFIQGLRDKNIYKFKNKYRNADVLLIDDIHFLQNKEETQEELFHTFNALYEANKQMVFTCDRPVSEIKSLSDRLRSRFERGLNVDLQPPSYETRYAILKKKMELANVSIPEEVLNLICTNVTTNVRDLEAALTKIIAYAELVNKNITLEIAQSQLKDMFSSPKQNNVTMDLIKKTVAEYFGLTYSDLNGKKRTKAIAFPRQVAMYIAREITEYSTTEVGLEFGGRDHTTVMHACQKIETRMRMDPTLEPIIQHLIRTIREHSSKG
ncbi:MAG: chromosomal replication initiator protein DnaA [Spirochaetes bacterium]|nr:chromosomal replication initiator protein DnaA [Spirochaetota bacterium]